MSPILFEIDVSIQYRGIGKRYHSVLLCFLGIYLKIEKEKEYKGLGKKGYFSHSRGGLHAIVKFLGVKNVFRFLKNTHEYMESQRVETSKEKFNPVFLSVIESVLLERIFLVSPNFISRKLSQQNAKEHTLVFISLTHNGPLQDDRI